MNDGLNHIAVPPPEQKLAPVEPLAIIAHEIRTPLGAMAALADLLSSTTLDQQQTEYVQSLKSAAASLQIILNDLLDHEKLNAGAIELYLKPFDPVALLLELQTLFAPVCSEKGLKLTHTIPAELPGSLIGDSHRLRQIITNFVNNAVKFTQTGSINLQLSIDPCDDGRYELTFMVEDSGIGLSSEAQKNLFKPYSQAQTSTASQYGGTGLGLSIAAKLAALMDGHIGCQSIEGVGSKFYTKIKCQPVSIEISSKLEQTEHATSLQSETVPIGLDGSRILVAEDNRINRTLISTYLSRFGCSFEFADTGVKAVELVQQGEFDVILMDIYMPQMTGTEATSQIRAMPAPFNALPILALSAGGPDEHQEKYIDLGFNGYIAKPIKPDVLYKTICDMIGRRDRRSVARSG